MFREEYMQNLFEKLRLENAELKADLDDMGQKYNDLSRASAQMYAEMQAQIDALKKTVSNAEEALDE